MTMISVYSLIMAKFLSTKNIKFRQEKAKTSNSNYFYFKIGERNFVLRISDHEQLTWNYEFSIRVENGNADLAHAQREITKYIGLLSHK